jgi:small-conductance mechanosensitive channel
MNMKMMKDLMGKKLLSTILIFFVMVMGFLFIPLEAIGQGSPSKAGPEAKATSEKPTTLAVPAVISIPDIASQATEVTNMIRDINAKAAPSALIESVTTLLPQKAGKISRQLIETEKTLQSEPTLAALQNQQQIWQEFQGDTSIWLQVLTKRATLIRESLNQLMILEETWTKTLSAAVAANAPQPILQQIKEVIAAISAERKPLEEQRSAVLDLQSKVAKEIAQCNAILAMISQVQQKAVGGILTRESVPVWKPYLWTHLATNFPARVREVIPDWRKQISDYMQEPAMGLPLNAGIFIILAFVFWMARRRLHQWMAGGEEISPMLTVFENPFAAALLCSLSIASGPHSSAPGMVKVLFEIMVFAPIIRIIKPVVDPRFLPELYVLWVLYALDAFRQALSGGQFSGQFIVIIETLAGAMVLMWSLVSGQLGHSSIQVVKLFRKSALAAFVTLVFIALTVGLVAGILGYLSLARILASEIVAGGAMAAGLYAFVRVFIGIVAFRLRVWPLRSLNMVVHHRNLIERRAHRLTILAACLVFLNRLLDYTGFLGPTLSWLKTILALKFERGSVSISVEDILAFILTVWASYLLSALLRFILQEDVYPRIGVQKGMAYATSSLINYIILALGFVVGLGIVGVSLTKMTVLAGAFGVGIGFGLQSIVNNFVSGLILLFERPLHVGDIIEMDGLNGEVRRIGMRASTVRTWHGSDIVVPNADLVTKQVTNWTLGDKLRRIDLPVGVNYGADPEEVIQIFKKVAKAHLDVLPSPEPSALFTGYGDSSINFELRAWTDKFNDWQRIQSDLATAVYHAGHEAGLSFPFPQRDVHILDYPERGTSTAPAPDNLQPSSNPVIADGEQTK